MRLESSDAAFSIAVAWPFAEKKPPQPAASPGPHRESTGFTLVELLVVIAIIGILAALLMPSLSAAKNKAAKATDINNLRQMMVALHIYTVDSQDVLPRPNWDNGWSEGWLYKADTSVSGPGRFRLEGGSFWPLLTQAKIYVCPKDNPQMSHWSDKFKATVQRSQQLSSYAMNGAVTGYTLMLGRPVKLSLMRPGDCAFWETDETEPYYFNDGANYPPEGVSARHAQGGVQAAFDSSVSYVKLEKWYQDVSDPNRNRLWCYPGSPNGRVD